MNATVVGYRVFAMMRAKKLVKDDLRHKGFKPSEVSVRDMDTMFRLYLEPHPELVREAVETIDRLTLTERSGSGLNGPWRVFAKLREYEHSPNRKQQNATSAQCGLQATGILN